MKTNINNIKQGVNKMNFKKNDYVMDCRNGRCLRLANDERQTRNRREAVGSEIYKKKRYRVPETNYVLLSDLEGEICMKAEKVIRGKHRMSESERVYVALRRELVSRIID